MLLGVMWKNSVVLMGLGVLASLSSLCWFYRLQCFNVISNSDRQQFSVKKALMNALESEETKSELKELIL